MKFFYFILLFLCALVISSGIGFLSGNMLNQYLNNEGLLSFSLYSLNNGIHCYYKDPRFAHAFFGIAIAAGFSFLPVFISVFFLWAQFMGRNKSLYGDARFANNRELKPFHYNGDYN
jgi:type IV secretory pathway TraG/TraD family ATPase VirD4